MQKKVGLLSYILLLVLAVQAQTPADKIFSKYGETEGVDMHMQSVPAKDSVTKKDVTYTFKTMTVEDNDDTKLIKKITKECEKLLSKYTIISSHKEDDSVVKIGRREKGGIVEMVMLIKEDDELTLISMQGKNVTEDMMKVISAKSR